jgi:NodT family efflux transporter outer membrane factor (OMF) lipoprotein
MTHRPPSHLPAPCALPIVRPLSSPRLGPRSGSNPRSGLHPLLRPLLRPALRPVLLALPLLLGACAVGPNYVRPTVEAPAAYKENAGWKQAQPQDAVLRGPWWESYGDPLLNSLIAQVSISNQNLAQADARYREARALVQSARSGYFPTIGANLSSTRSSAGGRGGQSSQTTTTTTTNGTTNATTNGTTTSQAGSTTSNTLTLDASWEIDLWGRVQRTVEAQRAGALASAGDLEATRLSSQAQLAQTYFALRFIDSQADLLQRTVADYQRSVQLNQNQYDAGIIAKSNLILAQTQLKTTQAQALDLGVQRAQFEHAIALLVGKAPADFSISHAQLTAAVPVIPVSMPSDLLERRPDVAAAERRVEAANAQIGVAKAAYFPRLSLSANGGAQSSSLANLLSLPNRFWSLGPALAATLFDGGARRAQVEQASATYDGTVAAYRQTVLTGFQEVEDNLAALRILEQEAAVQDEALQLSRRSVELVNNQYKAGIVTYLNVIQVQTTALNNERSALDVLNRRLAASVLLVKALGGGWSAAALPSTASIK